MNALEEGNPIEVRAPEVILKIDGNYEGGKLSVEELNCGVSHSDAIVVENTKIFAFVAKLNGRQKVTLGIVEGSEEGIVLTISGIF